MSEAHEEVPAEEVVEEEVEEVEEEEVQMSVLDALKEVRFYLCCRALWMDKEETGTNICTDADRVARIKTMLTLWLNENNRSPHPSL